jgi:surfeit locus 1 family protein
MSGRGRSDGPLARASIAIGAAALFVGFLALGNWQIERRSWKLDLIDRVEQRIHAPPANPPDREQWPGIGAARDEYRRLRASGYFQSERQTLVQAVTELGGGYWVLTPLRLADGTVVLVNRGFVAGAPGGAARVPAAPAGEVSVTGLLRLSEPGGTLLRRNDPAADRWFSRDVAAIAAARGLAAVAPYFIDAERAPDPSGATAGSSDPALPVAGLTVVSFRNNHLVYALTWYALALMVALAAGYWLWTQRPPLRRLPGSEP